ncbi:MAG: glycosyltransferase family 4 protein [Planctomycetes bacterium]|nr:glycosyltransferase family 4 protein [Planctomycetota bacterium]
MPTPSVGYVSGSVLAAGGIGTIAFHALQGLAREGALAWVSSPAPAPAGLPEDCLRPVRMPPARVLGWLPRGASVRLRGWWMDRHVGRLLAEGLHCLHAWNQNCPGALRTAGQLGIRRVVDRASHHPLDQDRILREEFDRRSLPYRVPRALAERAASELEDCEAVLAPSPAVRASLESRGVSAARVAVVPFGVDLERFRAGPPGEGPFRLLFVGQVSLRKGVPYLLEAWDRARPAGGVLELAGPVLPEVRGIAARFLGRDDVRLLGMRQDTESLYRSATACVFPSLEEGSALVSYEAMAAGRASIVTPRVGSLVEDRVHGRVVPPADAEALAEAIAELALDRCECLRMGEAARRRVEGFPWARYGAGVVAVHRALVAGEALPDLWPH